MNKIQTGFPVEPKSDCPHLASLNLKDLKPFGAIKSMIYSTDSN